MPFGAIERSLLKDLRDAYKDVHKVAAAKAKGVDPGSIQRSQIAILKAEQEIREEVETFAKAAAQRIDASAVTAVKAGMIDADSLVRVQLAKAGIDAGGRLVARRPAEAALQVLRQTGRDGRAGLLLQGLSDDAAATVRRELTVGVVRGLNPRDVARRLRGALDGNRSQALRVARTEMVGAYRDAAIMSYRQAPGLVTAWIWMAELDASTCEVCWAMHGSEHPTDDLFGTHPNCFPAGTLVAGPTALAATSRWWSGELVEIETANGRRLSATPNHPVLTAEGWVAAGRVHEGGYLVDSGVADRAARVRPYDDEVPVVIEQVAAALREAGGVSSGRVPSATEDFHGDGGYGDVDVVWADRLLLDDVEAEIAEALGEAILGSGAAMLPGLAGLGATVQAFGGVGSAAPAGVCERCEALSFFGRSVGREEAVGGGGVAAGHVVLAEESRDRVAADAERLGDRLLGLSGGVAFDQVVRVERRPFSGHVFNLQTGEGWYSANGLIVHNCRCRPVPKTIGWDEIDPSLAGIENTTVDLTPGTELFRDLSPADQLRVLGPGKFDLYRNGYIDLPDLVKVTQHPWGLGRGSKSIRELGFNPKKLRAARAGKLRTAGRRVKVPAVPGGGGGKFGLRFLDDNLRFDRPGWRPFEGGASVRRLFPKHWDKNWDALFQEAGGVKADTASKLARRLRGNQAFARLADDWDNRPLDFQWLASHAGTTWDGVEDGTYRAVAHSIRRWAGTSADDDVFALAMQRAIREEFGLQDAAHLGKLAGEVDVVYSRHGDAMRAFARAMHDETQDRLRAQGVTSVRLYRGFGIKTDEPLPVSGTGVGRIGLQPASSFSSDFGTARDFVRHSTDYNGVIIGAEVPAERILGFPYSGTGCLNELECVVLGPRAGDPKDMVRIWDGSTSTRSTLPGQETFLQLTDHAVELQEG